MISEKERFAAAFLLGPDDDVDGLIFSWMKDRKEKRMKLPPKDDAFSRVMRRLAQKESVRIVDAEAAGLAITLMEDVDEDELFQKAREVLRNSQKHPDGVAHLKISVLAARVIQLESQFKELESRIKALESGA